MQLFTEVKENPGPNNEIKVTKRWISPTFPRRRHHKSFSYQNLYFYIKYRRKRKTFFSSSLYSEGLAKLVNVAADGFRGGHPYNSEGLAKLVNVAADGFRGGHPLKHLLSFFVYFSIVFFLVCLPPNIQRVVTFPSAQTLRWESGAAALSLMQ